MKNLRNKKQTGFTLIELLVVIAIIGLLASVVLLALNSARQKSRDAKRLADMRQLASALELYFNDNSAYPTSATQGSALYILGSVSAPGLSPKYIGLIPAAPAPADPGCGNTGAASNEYDYQGGTGNGASYTMTFCLGGITGGYPAGPHTLTPAGIQ